MGKLAYNVGVRWLLLRYLGTFHSCFECKTSVTSILKTVVLLFGCVTASEQSLAVSQLSWKYWLSTCAMLSHSVMFDSLWPHELYPISSSVHEILQARILEWVAMSFSRGSSRPRDQTQVSCIVGRCFTTWATREVLKKHYVSKIPFL